MNKPAPLHLHKSLLLSKQHSALVEAGLASCISKVGVFWEILWATSRLSWVLYV